ncbi:hypothetical protein BBJ28_00002900 [Nothophytophthora sp. Chile5]|nr:hypothetical protein BBJ28_00002900 [Nothophytophthora sp. Chile5]
MPPHSFSLHCDDVGDDNNDPEADGGASAFGGVFVASSADVLNRWVVALTCGVSAFQQQQKTLPLAPDAKAADLVWQAVRLRVFELAESMALSTAVDQVAQVVPQQDLKQSEALRRRLQFLRSN